MQRKFRKNRMMMEDLEPRQLLTVVVSSGADSGVGTLRASLGSAISGETIQFLPSVKAVDLLSALQVSVPLTIDGPGADKLTINGGNKFQIFNINDGTGTDIPVTIDGLTLTGGKATNDGGAILNTENLSLINVIFNKNTAGRFGGAIASAGGNLTIQGCTFTGDKAAGDGGAIDTNFGDLIVQTSNFNLNSGQHGGAIWSSGSSFTVTDTNFLKNTATAYGGAVCYGGVGALNLDTVTLDSNTAGTDAGAIWLQGNAASTLDAVSMINNKAKGNGGGAWIKNGIDLTLKHSSFTGNSAVSGGALWLDTTAFRGSRLMVTGNTATQFGGGLYAQTSDTSRVVSLMRSSFGQNTALNGGALFNSGVTVQAQNSSFYLNLAKSDGGAFFNSGMMQLDACTLALNKAMQYGGGFLNFTGGNTTIRNSTVAQNNAGTGHGGGLENYFGTMRIDSDIVWGNTRGGKTVSDIEISGALLNSLSSHNLIGDSHASVGLSGNGNLFGQDPQLSKFGDFGGPTWTYAIPIGSPAIDAGNNLDNLSTDQRGGSFGRSVGNEADIGAFENENVGTYARQLNIIQGQTGRYTDATGNDVTATMTGNGVIELLFGSSSGNGNPLKIVGYNTDTKSKFALQARTPGVSTQIGDFKVMDSIGEINAPLVKLSGTLEVCGVPLKLIMGDVLANSVVKIDGRHVDANSTASVTLGDVTDATFTSAVRLSQLQVVRWRDLSGGPDVVTAPGIDKLLTIGTNNGIAGDWQAMLNITGVGQSTLKPVLGTVNIAGTLGGGANRDMWTITGDVGTFTLNKLFNTDIDISKSLTKFTITPLPGVTTPDFIYSNIYVHDQFTTGTLGKVQTDNSANGGIDFGITAYRYKSLSFSNELATKFNVGSTTTLPLTGLDFFVAQAPPPPPPPP